MDVVHARDPGQGHQIALDFGAVDRFRCALE
jgi:hypothetical protein